MADTKNDHSRKKTTLWNFLFLNVGFVISIFNGILIIPLYLHYIDSSLYGAWLATGNILTWITVVDPGVGDVLLQKVAFAIGKDDKKEIGVAIASGIIISVVLFMLAVLIGYSFSFFIGEIANINTLYRDDIISSFRIALWGTAFSLLADTFRNIVLAYQKTKINGIFLYSVIVLAIVLNIVLLIMGFGVYALAYAALFRGLATFAYSMVLTMVLIKKNKVHLTFQPAYFKSFSGIFAFTFSSRLFETIATNIDLILVSRYLGTHAVTVLDLSRRPLKLASGLANNVTISMLPALPHLFGSGQTDKIRATVMRIWTTILWSSGFLIGGFILFNYSLTANWVGKQFWVGNINNIIMCASFFILSIGYNLSNITYSMGDIRNNSIINVVKSVVYLLFLFILAKTMGMTGVLLSFLMPVIIMLLYYPKKVSKVAMLSAQHVKDIIRETSLIVLLLTLAALIVSFFTIQLSWIGLIISGCLYTAVFGVLLFSFSSLFREDASKILALAQSKLSSVKSRQL
ncbi:MAG: MATE family efflux transporter [Chitinophagaceae bacterium]